MVIHLQVLAPLLGPTELASIFGRVAQVFANSLAEAFQRLQPQVWAPTTPCAAGSIPANQSTLQAKHCIVRGVHALRAARSMGLYGLPIRSCSSMLTTHDYVRHARL